MFVDAIQAHYTGSAGAPPGRKLAWEVFIYRLDADGDALASTILKAWHAVAAVQWLATYREEAVHWETMCEPRGQQVVGACFRRAGYRSLGFTTGRTARRPPGHSHGARVWSDGTPKLVLYRGPLHRLPRCTL